MGLSTYVIDLTLEQRIGFPISSWDEWAKFYQNSYLALHNKASVSQLQKFAKISVVDGASYFAPKIKTKKTDC